MLVAASRSSLENVAIGADGVIDGFEITGKPTVNAGVLSTSIVNNGVEGAAGGLLYNSLVLGSVNAVKAVNVTSAEAINGAAGSGNNRGFCCRNEQLCYGRLLGISVDGDLAGY